MVSVAIDGPAGAGKSTLARRLAAELGYIYVDTGAMYRAIGLYALRAGKDPKDNAAVDALLPQIELRLASIAGEQHIYLKDEDVSAAIRTEAAGMAASAVGANPAVRAFLLELQRSMAKKQDVLMDGRDISKEPDAPEQEKNFLAELNRCISSHISLSNLNSEMIAKTMCLSKSQLNRKVKSLTGMSTSAYIKQLKLARAQMFLKDPEKTIGDIGMMCGFESASYFTKMFKEKFGITPSEYKKNNMET